MITGELEEEEGEAGSLCQNYCMRSLSACVLDLCTQLVIQHVVHVKNPMLNHTYLNLNVI